MTPTSQSPSLRGSGRFEDITPRHTLWSGFNPLHCGAVVASLAAWRAWRESTAFQSPSLRGSGRFQREVAAREAAEEVSIPFIAGQWSLPARAATPRGAPRVSIPFIAGQWSLLTSSTRSTRSGSSAFQSPSLRGSGRFRSSTRCAGRCLLWFQSPSLRGSGRFEKLRSELEVATEFQSPSLRGSGRFSSSSAAATADSTCFNPLHCGAVVASEERARQEAQLRVSIPFIAGQWSLLASDRRARSPGGDVSIPFIAGQWSLPW